MTEHDKGLGKDPGQGTRKLLHMNTITFTYNLHFSRITQNTVGKHHIVITVLLAVCLSIMLEVEGH